MIQLFSHVTIRFSRESISRAVRHPVRISHSALVAITYVQLVFDYWTVRSRALVRIELFIDFVYQTTSEDECELFSCLNIAIEGLLSQYGFKAIEL